MSSSDDYVLITESRNFSEEDGDPKVKKFTESADSALRALETHGIFLEEGADIPAATEPRDQVSREFMDQSGIEIVSSEEDTYSS